VWSVTSFNELRRDGLAVERRNLLHPLEAPQKSYVASVLEGHEGPVIAATDYLKSFADQIRPFVERRFTALGTDGFGRSDTREQLRAFFEVDARWIVLAALAALANEGAIERKIVAQAIERYGINPEKPNPVTV
jgi:pyruvate dehydrogenase E1 component